MEDEEAFAGGSSRITSGLPTKPTGPMFDGRGLSPSGRVRERPEDWVVGVSDSLIRIARSRLDQQGPTFFLTHAETTMTLGQHDFIRRAVFA